VSGRLFAAAYDWLLGPLERVWLARRRAALVGPAAGRVLEVGIGTGLTLPHYRRAVAVVGVDPNPAMLERARARAAAAAVPVVLEVGRAEGLPVETGRFDTAVASLVLCTVEDPSAAAREIHRALKPGGELRFLEHVRAPGRRLARLQDLVTPAWRRLFGNCHPNRDTLGVLTRAGFEVERLTRRLGGVVVEGTARAAVRGRGAAAPGIITT
jgi:ubiquinone/menaquinone biosynthesis C-methylase UbiE